MRAPQRCWCHRPRTATPPRRRWTSCKSPIARRPARRSSPPRRRSPRYVAWSAGGTHRRTLARVGAVIGGGDTPPPARIVLFSDGKETVPSNPNNPKGAFTAARAARDQGIPISTISFGTPNGYVDVNGQRQPLPVDDTTMKKVARLSGGTAYSATT